MVLRNCLWRMCSRSLHTATIWENLKPSVSTLPSATSRLPCPTNWYHFGFPTWSSLTLFDLIQTWHVCSEQLIRNEDLYWGFSRLLLSITPDTSLKCFWSLIRVLLYVVRLRVSKRPHGRFYAHKNIQNVQMWSSLAMVYIQNYRWGCKCTSSSIWTRMEKLVRLLFQNSASKDYDWQFKAGPTGLTFLHGCD